MRGKIEYREEHVGHHHGQDDMELGLYIDDEIIGMVQYTLFDGELTVRDIIVRPEFRRQGYGSRMMKYIKQLHPEYKYVPSLKTDLGAKFIHKDIDLNELRRMVREVLDEDFVISESNLRIDEALAFIGENFLSENDEPSPTFEWDFVKSKIDDSKKYVKTKEQAYEYLIRLLEKVKSLPKSIKIRIVKYVALSLVGILGYSSIKDIVYKNLPEINREISTAMVSDTSNNLKVEPRKSSDSLVKMLKEEEGSIHKKGEPVLEAYMIGDGMITIGWGHAERIGESQFKPGQKITKEKAEELLAEDIAEAESGLNKILDDWKSDSIDVNINQSMYDAMTSMIFNMGIGNFRKSEFIQLVKQGKYDAAGEKILTTNVTYPGHVIRRQRESELFLKDINKDKNFAQNTVREDVEFQDDSDEEDTWDRVKIIARNKSGEEVGHATLEMSMFPEYEFRNYDGEGTSDLSDEEIEQHFPDEYSVAKLEHLEVKPEFMKMGFGKELMDAAVKYIKERGYSTMYLLASPIGVNKIDLDSLTNFYKKYGFEIIKDYGNSRGMVSQLGEEIVDSKFSDDYDFSKHSFTSGDCDIYAISLHRLYGYPIYVVRGWYLEPDLGQDEIEWEYEDSHMVVKLPNGNYMDSHGETTEAELRQNCAFSNDIAKITFEPLTEEEALFAFSCQDQEADVQKVMNYIKSKDIIKENASIDDFKYDAVKKIIQGAINNGAINPEDISPDKYFIICFGMFGNHISTVGVFDKGEAKNLIKNYKNQDDVWKIYVEKPTVSSLVFLRKESGWIQKINESKKVKEEREVEGIDDKTKMSIFDFDKTLVMTPEPEEGMPEWEEKTGKKWEGRWWENPNSLNTDIFEMPVNSSVISAYKKEKSNPHNLVVMMTGRIKALSKYVEKVLDMHGLKFEDYLYKDGAETSSDKMKKMELALKYNPNIREIEMWDDRDEHIPIFQNWGNTMIDMGYLDSFKINHVKGGHISEIRELVRKVLSESVFNNKTFIGAEPKVTKFMRNLNSEISPYVKRISDTEVSIEPIAFEIEPALEGEDGMLDFFGLKPFEYSLNERS